MAINDYLNIVSKLTFRRLWNILLLRMSYSLTRLTKGSVHWGMPYAISVEPTTSCNLRCPECPSGMRHFTRNTGMLNLELFENIINQMSDHLLYMTLYFQGEPYLNPSFFDFVKKAGEKKIYTATSTNAHFLTEENARKTVESGLDRLIISLDGIGQKAYGAYRVGGRYRRVIEGIENIVKLKKSLKSKTPHIIVQFIVFRSNEHQLKEIKELCRELGVDELQFKTAQIDNYENGNLLIPSINKYSRYKEKPDGTWIFKNKLPNRCNRMWTSSVITWDGLTVPCCFDKDAEYRLGNLRKISFKEIWKSRTYIDFRKQVFTSRKQIDICKNCTEGLKL